MWACETWLQLPAPQSNPLHSNPTHPPKPPFQTPTPTPPPQYQGRGRPPPLRPRLQPPHPARAPPVVQGREGGEGLRGRGTGCFFGGVCLALNPSPLKPLPTTQLADSPTRLPLPHLSQAPVPLKPPNPPLPPRSPRPSSSGGASRPQTLTPSYSSRWGGGEGVCFLVAPLLAAPPITTATKSQ